MDIDVNKNRQMIFDLQGIPLFNEKMTFFYDETGNCRKFSLTDGMVNSQDAIYNDFILGGIAFCGNNPNSNVDELFAKLHLQQSQKEIKFKHFKSKSGILIDTLSNERITILLNWLVENEFYIHFSTLNNLYYALVDIIDSLYETHKLSLPLIEKPLKTAIYRFSLCHQGEVLSLLSLYRYPDIKREQVKDFCNDFANLLWSYNEDTTPEGFYIETLRQMLKTAGKTGELVFLHDNTAGLLIDEYYLFYNERCEIFPNSKHIFDEEPTVIKAIKSINMIYNGMSLKNYEFVNSRENRFIQISDVIVGLLGQLFYFLDRTSIDLLEKFKCKKYERAIYNIKNIALLINRANNKSPYFIKNCNDIFLIKEREEKLSALVF